MNKPDRQPRPVWTGTLRLDEVTVPVQLFVCQQRNEHEFRTLHNECGTPLKQKRWCPTHEREVETSETVKAWEPSPGRFVPVEPAELEPASTKELELDRIIPAADVSPLCLDRSYYLAPLADEPDGTAYAVLQAAFAKTGLAGIGRLVMYGKEHLTLVRTIDGTLVLSTLYLADELRTPPESPAAPADMTKLAIRMLRARAGTFNPKTLVSGERVRIKKLLEKKLAAGNTIGNAADDPEDLEASLRGSIRAHTRRSPARSGSRRTD